ncbi:hypothetical protein ACO0QE_004082 [Hanseniaspora vineae]
MSSEQKPTAVDSSKVAPKVTSAVTTPELSVKPKKNPAFAAMGIPSFKAKLPGPKWMAFWCVVAAGIGGVVYDKREQNKIREKYCELVKQRLEESNNNKNYPWYMKSRKISVFIAPPPNDYLETSMKTWRRFIKPVLYSSGIDYELFTTDTQGALRLQVSREIRNLRKSILEHEAELEKLRQEQELHASYKYKINHAWELIKNGNTAKLWNRLTRKNSATEQEVMDPVEEMIQGKKFKAEFDLKNLLGVFYDNEDMAKHAKSITEDSLQDDVVLAGGVLCLGRGAYKEYLAGINEGLLGPLEMPESVAADLEAKKEEWRELQRKNFPDQLLDETKMPDYVPKSFLENKDTQTFTYPPPELKGKVRDSETNIPYFFKQPLICVPQPIISGLVNFPRKVYRFYTKRYLVEEYCRYATSVVLQDVRPFTQQDLVSGKTEEEDEWPSGWVKTGISKNSEWVQPAACDSRILKDLSTYNTESVPYLYSSAK